MRIYTHDILWDINLKVDIAWNLFLEAWDQKQEAPAWNVLVERVLGMNATEIHLHVYLLRALIFTERVCQNTCVCMQAT